MKWAWFDTVGVVSGEFQVVNQHLLKDLTELGIWGEEMKHKLIAHHGSVQVGLLSHTHTHSLTHSHTLRTSRRSRQT